MEQPIIKNRLNINNKILESSVSKLEFGSGLGACVFADLYNVFSVFWIPIVLLSSIFMLVILFYPSRPKIVKNKRKIANKKYSYFDFSDLNKRFIVYPLLISLASILCFLIEKAENSYKQKEIERLERQAYASMGYNVFYQENTFADIRDLSIDGIWIYSNHFEISSSAKKAAQGVYLLENDQPSKGLEMLYEASNEGDPAAKYFLAISILQGRNIEKDEVKAFSYMLDAAQLEVIHAQSKIAIMYMDGVGTIADLEKAKLWALKAISHTTSEYSYVVCVRIFNDLIRIFNAMENCEELYDITKKFIDDIELKGQTLNHSEINTIYNHHIASCLKTRHYKEAYKLALKGIDKNLPLCYLRLSYMYKQSIYVKQNYEEAERLLFEALKKFNIGYIELAELYNELDMQEEQAYWSNVVYFYENI